MAKDMGTMGSFFVRYLMQVALIFNTIYLLDIPHFLVRKVRIWIHKRRYKALRDRGMSTFKDTWYFDLGYFQAYALTMFFLAMLFSAVIPLISVFAFLFFFLRFSFDKYNQTFVYFKEFEAKGRLRKHVIHVIVVVLLLAQLLNFAFFKVIGLNCLGLGVALVCLEVCGLFGFAIH